MQYAWGRYDNPARVNYCTVYALIQGLWIWVRGPYTAVIHSLHLTDSLVSFGGRTAVPSMGKYQRRFGNFASPWRSNQADLKYSQKQRSSWKKSTQLKWVGSPSFPLYKTILDRFKPSHLFTCRADLCSAVLRRHIGIRSYNATPLWPRCRRYYPILSLHLWHMTIPPPLPRRGGGQPPHKKDPWRLCLCPEGTYLSEKTGWISV